MLDEWAIRCLEGNIRLPVGYLFQIISKAQQGLFHPCMAIGIDYQDEADCKDKDESNDNDIINGYEETYKPVSREQAQENLRQIKELIKGGSTVKHDI